MHIQWKAKGILVPVFGIVPLLGLQFLRSAADDYLCNNTLPAETILLTSGLAILLSGLWTLRAAEDFYTDEEGNKHPVDFDNKFMFLDMKIWAFIFFIIGGFAFI